MSPTGTSAFDLYQKQVEGMMQNEVALASVEAALDGAELPAEERAVLWLLAWSLRGRRPCPHVLAKHGSKRRALALVPTPGTA
jgi:hypothetical protein